MNADSPALLPLQLALMVGVTILIGKTMVRFGMPALVGELFGGIILGPTILGTFFPDLHANLFPTTGVAAQARDGIVQFGLILFLFIAGLEVEFEHLARHKRAIALTTLLGVSVPFAAGMGSALLLPDIWGMGANAGKWTGPVFVGTILSISAIPVIARILMDLSLTGTAFGAIVLAAATIDDLIGWGLFGFVVSQISGRGAGDGHGWAVRVGLIVALGLVIFSIGTTNGRRVLKWVTRRIDKTGSYVPLMLMVMLLAAAAAEWIGTHTIFGAFLVGVAIARTSEPRRQAYAALRGVTLDFFVPLYMVSIGLRTNFAVNFDPVLVSVVMVVATFGKLAGASLGARLGGLKGREALAIGFALNARGAMAIVLTSVALDFQLINERVFVALIFMAVATSALAASAIPRVLAGGLVTAKDKDPLLSHPAVESGV